MEQEDWLSKKKTPQNSSSTSLPKESLKKKNDPSANGKLMNNNDQNPIEPLPSLQKPEESPSSQNPLHEEEIPLEGTANICFFSLEDQWFFQGYFIDKHLMQFGIYGEQTQDHPPIDCCLFDRQDTPVFFDFSFIDFQEKVDYVGKIVKTFGDYARLRCDAIEYKSHTLSLPEDSSFKKKMELFPKLDRLNLQEERFIVTGNMQVFMKKLKPKPKIRI